MIEVTAFGGIAPRSNPRALPEGFAQTASNVDARRLGSLRPLKEPGPKLKDLPFDVKTIWRYKRDHAAEDDKWWVVSKNDVDFVRPQQALDEREMVVFTDNDDDNVKPQFFCSDQITETPTNVLYGSLSGPNRTFDLGVPRPDVAPTAALGAAPAKTDGLLRSDTLYVFTYVWSICGYRMESAPSPASAVVAPYGGGDQSVTLTTGVTAVPSSQMETDDVTKRIYKAVGGRWFYLGEIPVTQDAFEDDGGIAPVSPLDSLEWDPPPASLKGMTLHPAMGCLAGFDGKSLYLSEPGVPYAWPVGYIHQIESPIVALVSLDTTLVVLTDERPYFVQGSHPTNTVVVKSMLNQGCASKRSALFAGGMAWYVSPDGVVATSPASSEVKTLRSFAESDWQDHLDPATTFAAFHDGRYVGWHSKGGFVYDLLTMQFMTTDEAGVDAGMRDDRLDRLYISEGTELAAWGRGDYRSFVWRSRKYTLPFDVSYTAILVEAESYGDLRCRVIADGRVLCDDPVSGRVTGRLPVGMGPARDWEIEVRGKGEVYRVSLAQSPSQLGVSRGA